MSLQITHPAQERLTTPPGSTSPTIFEKWCWFFYVPQEPDKQKCCETGPTVFRPCPKRLESLTVCRCHCKGSTFSSVILKTWVLVRPAFEPATSRSADSRSPNPPLPTEPTKRRFSITTSKNNLSEIHISRPRPL